MILLYFMLVACPASLSVAAGLLRGVDAEDRVSVEHRHGHRGGGHRSSSHERRHDDGGSKENGGGDFDFYVYSMTHQPEFCRENDERYAGCRDHQESWEWQLTIHGLWPNRNDGSYPSSCTNEALDPALLADLSSDLGSKWPNVKAMSGSEHASFWSHEWSKHGTCSGLDQKSYFATALGLLLPTPTVVREKYGSVVAREDLIGGYDGTGTAGGGGGASSSGSAVLVCKNGYLSEVRVCYEKVDGSGAVGGRMACPDVILREDNCGDQIEIASFGDDDPTPSTTTTEGVAAETVAIE